MAEVIHLTEAKPGMRVLDLGTGTGNLAVLLTARRLRVWGLDFSRKMLSLVRAKVPEAVFVQGDIAFSTFRGRDTVRRWWHALWDKKEHYWVAKEAVPALKQAGFQVSYHQISSCGRSSFKTGGERARSPRLRLTTKRRRLNHRDTEVFPTTKTRRNSGFQF